MTVGDPHDRPGPKPERVKIEVDWEEAVKKALGKERPEGGWPKGDEPEEPEDDAEKPEDD